MDTIVGLLHFVGHSRVYNDAAEIVKLLEPLKDGTGFTGCAPGGKNRWTGQDPEADLLDPRLVAELSADHISGGSSGTVRGWSDGVPTRHRKMQDRSDSPLEPWPDYVKAVGGGCAW